MNAQHEAFDLTRRRGYYAWLRETTLQEWADDLGMVGKAQRGRR